MTFDHKARPAARAAALALFATAAASVATPAAAQAPGCKVDTALTVVIDTFIPAVAVARPGPNGGMIAYNPDHGLALGRETQEWLLERQCYLVSTAGSEARIGTTGLLEFSPGEHKDADCVAFQRVTEANGGRANVVRVIDRDVSQQARGTYWDVGMGDIRLVASKDCQ